VHDDAVYHQHDHERRDQGKEGADHGADADVGKELAPILLIAKTPAVLVTLPSTPVQNMNQFVSGLQQASAAGLTTLPSRDIPQTQSHLTQDQQMQPNYVPQEHQHMDYIREQQTNEEIIRKHSQREQQTNSLDNFYNNIQTPILIAILYFLFQLPVVRKNIFKRRGCNVGDACRKSNRQRAGNIESK
jgi:hypothetical protein